MSLAASELLARLGLALSGSNLDLAPVPSDEDGDNEGEGGGEPGEGEDESDDEGKGSGKGGEDSEDESEGDPEGSGEGEGDEDDESEGEGESDGDGDEPEDSDKEGSNSDGSTNEGEGGDEAGGEGGDDTEPDPLDMKDLAENLMGEAEKGEEPDLKDASKALENALDAEDTDVETGEQAWRPSDPSSDQVVVVNGPASSLPAARAILESVRSQASFLRNQMRAKFLRARKPKTTHGVRKGTGLSERRLVGSYVEIKSGRRATRPDWRTTQKEECSLAVALVLDESGSMCGSRMDVARGALAIASSMDQLGAPCLVVGPRGGGGWGSSVDQYRDDGSVRFHRSQSIILDVFKDWEEPLNKCLARFAHVQARGGTPLSDGIQYALQELNTRPERHRVVIVITDGVPNCSAVVRRQIRIAREAKVEIIGVGIDDEGCDEVPLLFPMNVCVRNVADLPPKLLGILTGIMFPKRGQKIQLEHKVGR